MQITFAGQTIRDTTLSGIESGGGSGGKYAIWLALGGTVPHGSFGNAYKRGFAATLGFEYMFKPSYSVEATLSGYRFGGKSGVADLDVTQIGVNAKWYLTPAPLRWFATAGVGSYAFSPGSTHMGVNAGAGLQYTLTPSLSLEARYGLHSVSGNAPSARFSTLQAGLRYKF